MHITHRYRGVTFTVAESGNDGVFEWRFMIDGRVVRGRTKTRLIDLALREAAQHIVELPLRQCALSH